MLIVCGTKLRHRDSGSAKLFCPICREVKAFRVSRAFEHRHLYLLTYGTGTPVSDTAICDTCGCEFPQRAGRFETYDENLVTAIFERQALESKARTGMLTAEERKFLLQEPFLTMDYSHRRRLQTGTQTSIASVLIVVTSVLGIVCASQWFMLAGATPRERASIMPWVIGCSTALLMLLLTTAWFVLTNHRRRSVRHELPHIASSLLALKPTVAELEVTLSALQAENVHIVRGMSLQHLRGAMEQAATRTSRA